MLTFFPPTLNRGEKTLFIIYYYDLNNAIEIELELWVNEMTLSHVDTN